MEVAMNIDFGQVFSRAWTVTWKHKILWLFGFLAILAGSGNANVSFNGSGYRFGNGDVPRYYGQLPPEIQSIVDWANKLDWTTIVAYVSIALALVCVLWLICFILSVIGRGGLIGGILKADFDGTISFREAWTLGRRYFWRILAVKIVSFLTMLVASIIVGVSFVMAIIPLVCCLGIPLCLLAIGGILFLSLYFYFVQIAIVAENLSIGVAFGKAFNILRDRIGPAFLFGIVTFLVSLGVGLGMLILFVPSVGMFLAAFWPMMIQTGPVSMGLLYAALIIFLVTLPIAWLVQSVLETWRTAVWALAYKRFALPPAAPQAPAK
jgi:hypothetical protein